MRLLKQTLLFFVLLLLPVTALAAEEPAKADEQLALSLMPGYEFVEGILSGDGREMRLLMRRPDGDLVFVGGVHDDETGWQMTESTPLPQGTHIGYANFPSSLALDDDRCLVSVGVYASGKWGVTLISPEGGGVIPLGANWIDDAMNDEPLGDHPWSDITRIDWSALPAGYEEAAAQLDPSRWARVNIPEGILHLHVQPDHTSAVLGGYYSGAPVRIVENAGEWTRVEILGLEGWMQTAFLAVGAEMVHAEYRGPWLGAVGGGAMLHEQPLMDSPSRYIEDNSWNAAFCVVGMYNEEWYHVWCFSDDAGGYIHRDELWEGNG